MPKLKALGLAGINAVDEEDAFMFSPSFLSGNDNLNPLNNLYISTLKARVLIRVFADNDSKNAMENWEADSKYLKILEPKPALKLRKNRSDFIEKRFSGIDTG